MARPFRGRGVGPRTGRGRSKPGAGAHSGLELTPENVRAVVGYGLLDLGAPFARNRPRNTSAGKILRDSGLGFVIPTARRREALLVAFVREGFVVYGKAFDAVRVEGTVDLEDENDIRKNLRSVVLYEIKATSTIKVQPDFGRHFFSLSTAELLVAQSLRKHYRFAFVNTRTGTFLELTLQQVFARARGIYPGWSIQF
jgi:hypothetical protein